MSHFMSHYYSNPQKIGHLLIITMSVTWDLLLSCDVAICW